nr:LIM domain-containing protein WLIM1-like [Tanacetum cinerariifolium]
VDKLEANKRIYHKACFRCHHCNGTLKLSNFNSFDGVVYCRHHFDQLFKRTGSLEKSFEGTPKFKLERTVSYEPSPSKLANFFEGTRDKCVGCSKIVYPIER